MKKKKYAGVDLVIKQSKKLFPEKLESAILSIDGESWVATNVLLGHVTLDDGRVAQITFKLETDQDEWMEDEA